METPPVSNNKSHSNPSSIKARSRPGHPEQSPAAPPRHPRSEPAPPANTNSNSESAPAPASRQSPPLRRRSKAPPPAASGKPARDSCRPMPQSQRQHDPAAVRDPAAVVPPAPLPRAEQNFRHASTRRLDLHKFPVKTSVEYCGSSPPRVPHSNAAVCAALGWEPPAKASLASPRSSTAEVCSTITTASAPAGSGAPVMIPTACPRPTEHDFASGQSPAFTSPTTSSRAGTSAKSAARTAYPSRVARAKGGKSRSATIPSASTRPNPASRSTVSASSGHTPAACFSTRCRATSKLTTPAAVPAEGGERGRRHRGIIRRRILPGRERQSTQCCSEEVAAGYWQPGTGYCINAPVPVPAP